MRATVLVDNRKCGGIRGEWGLCICVENGGHTLLLDTGASDLFAENAEKLGVDLAKVDAAVLSHAHYDHANGMAAFFRRNDKAKFYVGKTCAPDCYAKRWIFRRYIGVPKTVLQDYDDRIVYADGDREIFSGVYLIPHKTSGLERVGLRENMYRRVNGKWIPDDFSHEQSLVIDTQKGLVIFNSCSHGGADCIIREVAETFPDKTVYAIIGGFHLYNKSEAEVRALAERIRQTGIAYVCTGHCTKDRAYEILRQELGDKLHRLQVGLVMDF